MKYKIGYIDEDITQVEKYERELRPYFDLIGYNITEGLELGDLLKQVYESNIDLLLVDYLMVDNGILTYNGDTVAREYQEIKPGFPVIVFTNREADAFPQVDNPNMLYDKSLVKEELPRFVEILKKNITLYEKYINSRKGTIETLLLKSEKEGLSAEEKHILLQTQSELINLDKWSTEVPFQLLTDAKLDSISETTKEAEEFLQSLINKKD